MRMTEILRAAFEHTLAPPYDSELQPACFDPHLISIITEVARNLTLVLSSESELTGHLVAAVQVGRP